MCPYSTYGFSSSFIIMARTSSGSSYNFELQIVHLSSSLPLPSCLPLVSIEAGKYLQWGAQCAGAWWWLPLSGLPWIPERPARGSYFAWHHHPLSWAPLRSSSTGNKFNASALLLSSCIEIPMQRKRHSNYLICIEHTHGHSTFTAKVVHKVFNRFTAISGCVNNLHFARTRNNKVCRFVLIQQKINMKLSLAWMFLRRFNMKLMWHSFNGKPPCLCSQISCTNINVINLWFFLVNL